MNACDSTDNDFNISQIKLEAGQIATPFIGRPIGEELALCQRYCVAWNGYSEFAGYCTTTTNARVTAHLPVPLRDAATLNFGTAANWRVRRSATASSATALALINQSDLSFSFDADIGSASLVANDGVLVASNGETLIADAEL